MENIVRRRYWWFAISLLIIVPGAVLLGLYGLRLGIDFSGGSLWGVSALSSAPRNSSTPKRSLVFLSGRASRMRWCSLARKQSAAWSTRL